VQYIDRAGVTAGGADDPLDGTMPREVRSALRSLAQNWRSHPDASQACSAFVAILERAAR
jgi:hypothetical protein